MNKTCIHCGTQIPMIASRCPNCTTHLNTPVTGGSGGDAGSALAIIFLFCVFGIGHCLGFIK